MTQANFKIWYAVHKWSSLICTLFMLLLCLTGLPLIFSHEIDHMLGHSVEAPTLTGQHGTAKLDDIIKDAGTRKPGHKIQFLVGDADEPELWHLRLGKTAADPEASAFFTYDARTGEMINAYPVNEGIMHIILRLHVDMFAGLYGMLFLGFMGILLILSLISGVVVYGLYMRRLKFGTVRHNHSSRLKWLDLHNLIGIVTLAWLLVVGFTGVVNTLSIPIFNHWQSTQLVDMAKPYQHQSPLNKHGSIDSVVAAALSAEPNMQISFIAFPGNAFASPHHFVAFMQGKSPLTSKLLKPLLIDAKTGVVVDKRDLPWYVSALLLSQPLHFGDYGSMPLKLIWALLDILSIILLASGIYLWLVKRKTSVYLDEPVAISKGENRAIA